MNSKSNFWHKKIGHIFMPSDNIGHAEQFNTTNKNDGSLWQKLTFF